MTVDHIHLHSIRLEVACHGSSSVGISLYDKDFPRYPQLHATSSSILRI